MNEKWFYIVYSKFAIIIITYKFWVIQHVDFVPRYFQSRFILHIWKNGKFFHSTTKQDSNQFFTANWRTIGTEKRKSLEARSVYAPNVERLIEVDVSCSDRRKVDVIVIVVIITVIISITDIRHRPIEFHSEI